VSIWQCSSFTDLAVHRPDPGTQSTAQLEAWRQFPVTSPHCRNPVGFAAVAPCGAVCPCLAAFLVASPGGDLILCPFPGTSASNAVPGRRLSPSGCEGSVPASYLILLLLLLLSTVPVLFQIGKMDKPVIAIDEDDLCYGDWRCSHCSYINFGKRIACTDCAMPRRGSSSSRGRGGGRGGRAGSGQAPLPAPLEMEEEKPTSTDDRPGSDAQWGQRNPVAAATAYAAKIDIFKAGPPGKFKEGDWPCPSCGNINYARRLACNTW